MTQIDQIFRKADKAEDVANMVSQQIKETQSKCDYCQEEAETTITAGDEQVDMCEACADHYLN